MDLRVTGIEKGQVSGTLASAHPQPLSPEYRGEGSRGLYDASSLQNASFYSIAITAVAFTNLSTRAWH